MNKNKSGSPRKRTKAYVPKMGPRNKAPSKYVRGITENGKFIATAMEEHSVAGSWKDYVLFVGDQMLDAWGTYSIARVSSAESTGEPATKTVALLHKRRLALAIGPHAAARFWNCKLKRRTNHGAKANNAGRQAKS